MNKTTTTAEAEDRQLIDAVLLRTRLTVGWEDVLRRAQDKPGATPQQKVRAVLKEDRTRRKKELRGKVI